MDAVSRLGGAAVLIVGALLIGIAAGGGGDAPQKPRNMTVSMLHDELPLDEPVRVTASVTRTMPDYTADSGNTYQQFRVGDGTRTVKVFCGTRSGRVNVSRGDRVRIPATFQEYYGTYELYTRCSAIRILQRAEPASTG